MDAGEGPDAGDAPPSPDDDASVDLLAKDRVGAADVSGPFWRDRGRLQAESSFTKRLGRVHDHLVSSFAPPLEREVEITSLHLKPEHIVLEQANRLFQQLLASLVAVQHDHG